ncbi:serine/threonine phosphatase [Dyella lipolytica]|uniref:Serine/threonine-protein phosphatase n=1 Tax=Dyella lipolytica TaxID=1867835 RepID=A0ABW8IZ08_9GAMM|nr:PP2C family serine/threonine-protein phosphatase [Dyella lipolytica]GLQ48494.1 serine/threonine phosphatase [Dyella lipolytica]
MDDQIEIKVSPAVVAGRAKGGRPTQQDDLICLHDQDEKACLLVLADGMGGHGAGELASRLVIETALQLWKAGRWKEQAGALFLETLCQEAHQRLLQSRDVSSGAEPHSTVVCLLIKRDLAFWAHVGDSRLYRFKGRRFLGCTVDHSVMQASGHHGQQHLLLQGLGGSQAPQVEHGCMPAHASHTFVMCSDGVWAHLSTKELRTYVHRHEHEHALEEALRLVLQRGGEQGDNASLIFVRQGSISAPRQRGIYKWLALFGLKSAAKSGKMCEARDQV